MLGEILPNGLLPIESNSEVNKSIELIVQDNENNLSLNPVALEKIRSLKGKVAICVCVGQYRSGKSFLLSRLMANFSDLKEIDQIFEIDHGQDSFTKGCWMNSIIPKIKIGNELVNLLFIDTEGIDSADDSTDSTNKLFIFSMLISSLFIYNTNVTLSADLFKNLTFMTSIANRIKVSSLVTPDQSDDEDADSGDLITLDTKKEGPVFLAVIRNFTLKEQYSAKEDINRFIKVQSNSNDVQEKRKNEIRQAMIDSFRSLECARLPPPAYSLKQVQNLENQKFEDLAEEFQTSFLDMCDFIHTLIEPKKIKGVEFNGFMMAEYMKLCVEIINKEKSVFLYDTLQAVCNLEEKYNEEMYLEISTQLKSKAKSLPSQRRLQLTSSLLRKLESCIDSKLVSTFATRLVAEFLQIEVDLLAEKLPVQANRLYDHCEKIREDCLTFKISLNSEIFTQKFDELKKINLEKVKSLNEKLASTFWSQKTNYKHYEGKQYGTIELFERDYENFKREFSQTKQFDSSVALPNSFWAEFERANNLAEIRAQIKHFSDKKAIEAEKARVRAEQVKVQEAKNRAEQQERDYNRRLQEAKDRAEQQEKEHNRKLLEAESRAKEANKKAEEARLAALKAREEAARSTVYMSPPATPSYTPSRDYCSPSPSYSYSSGGSAHYQSRGSANGSEVFTGPRGGTYYVNSSGNKQYVSKSNVRYH